MKVEERRGLYRFAVATVVATILLLIAGALVTNNAAGDSVPDWPLAYHRLIPPLIGGVVYEWSHRVVAGIVSVLTLVLACWAAFAERRAWVKWLGGASLALVIAQAVLGGIRVLDGYPAITATAHAVLGQLFFLAVVGLALALSPWWRAEQPLLEDRASPSALSISAWTTAVIFIQLILGAAFRHGAFGYGPLAILPHIIGAAAVTVMVIWAGRAVKTRFRESRELRRGVIWLHSLFGVQILLGIAAYGVVQAAAAADTPPTLAYVSITVAHTLFGALTLASSLLLTLLCARLVRSAPSPHAESHPARVPKASAG